MGKESGFGKRKKVKNENNNQPLCCNVLQETSEETNEEIRECNIEGKT